MRISLVLAAIATAVAGPVGAQIAPETDGYEIEVSYGDKLASYLDRVNQLEQTREERFRKHGFDELSHREAGTQRFADALTAGTQWATVTLIPEVEDVTVTNLVKAMTAANVNRAAPEFEGKIRYSIDSLKVEGYSVAFLDGISSYVSGAIEVLNPQGEVIESHDLTANLVLDHTVDRSYEGEKFAFIETDAHGRIGPTLSYFVERALEKVWPDRRDRIHGPIIVRVSGPNEMIFEGSRLHR